MSRNPHSTYSSRVWVSVVIVAAVFLLCVMSPPLGAQGLGKADYDSLRAGRFAGPIAVPAEGLAFEIDTARAFFNSRFCC